MDCVALAQTADASASSQNDVIKRPKNRHQQIIDAYLASPAGQALLRSWKESAEREAARKAKAKAAFREKCASDPLYRRDVPDRNEAMSREHGTYRAVRGRVF